MIQPRQNGRRRSSAFIATVKKVFFFAALFCCLAAGAADNRIFDDIIQKAAKQYRVDPVLIKAMIWRESRFKPRARGAAGEIGLMQIKQCTVVEWAKWNKVALPPRDKVFDPMFNIYIGTWSLSASLKRWEKNGNSVPLALAEYNAGRTALLKMLSANGWRLDRAIAGTSVENYIRDIRDKYMEYKSELQLNVASVK